MAWQISKLFLAAAIITLTSWIAGKNPKLGGLMVAFPLASMLSLAFNRIEYKDPGNTVEFARSIFASIPLSLLFFVPFLFAKTLRLDFWALYLAGTALLALGYALQMYFIR